MFPMKKSSQVERECLKISVFKNYFGECKKTSLFFYISMGWERVDTRKETSGMQAGGCGDWGKSVGTRGILSLVRHSKIMPPLSAL